MNRKTGILISALLALALAVGIAGCRQADDALPPAAEDEVKLAIHLDLQEDIGLLVLDCTLDGATTSGGVCNVDKSLLKRDEVLDWTLSKQDYGNPADPAQLTLRFKVITAYFDPNYENDYPAEYTVPLEPLSFTVVLGQTYHLTITGDRENGYQAALMEP